MDTKNALTIWCYSFKLQCPVYRLRIMRWLPFLPDRKLAVSYIHMVTTIFRLYGNNHIRLKLLLSLDLNGNYHILFTR
jgi:hypothetical protein